MTGFRRALAMLAGVVALSGALVGCGSAGSSIGGETRYLSGSGTISTIAVGARKVAPAVTGTTLDGAALDLADYRGKVVVLNFWASWCPPCRAEAKDLERVSTDTKALGVQFVGVNIKDDSLANARTFNRANGVTYPSLFDQPGRIGLLFRDTLPPTAIPSTLVIDRQGRLAARGLGGLTADELAPIVRAVAAES